MKLDKTASPTGGELAPSYQMTVNQYLLQEIQKLRADQMRISDELLAIKLENMRLSAQVKQLPGTLSRPSRMIPPPDKASGPMVVFDLTSKPATVMTANDKFAEMLGYKTSDVLHRPWHLFIHPDFVQRTMNLLGKNTDSSITFDQVYKTASGEKIATRDTHNLLYDSGRPIADIVHILPLPHELPIPSVLSSTTPAVSFHQPLALESGPSSYEDTKTKLPEGMELSLSPVMPRATPITSIPLTPPDDIPDTDLSLRDSSGAIELNPPWYTGSGEMPFDAGEPLDPELLFEMTPPSSSSISIPSPVTSTTDP